LNAIERNCTDKFHLRKQKRMKQSYIKNKQSGVSLIEILVTTLVLGVGLLGVASLQVASVSSNQEGLFTSQATSIAEDLASRIRSAKMTTLIPYGDRDHASLVSNYAVVGEIACDPNTPPANLCRVNGVTAAADCNFTDIAIYDRWEACVAASEHLPQGKVRIVNVGNRISLVVDWNSLSEKMDLGSKKIVNANCASITGDVDRNCVILEIVP